ncbi:Imm72 family immunity protein [Massilia glaciei]|nr:Imm72 family immunity protein [Massilia glaciei]
MSIYDIFKTSWSAGTMTAVDRRKLFWYLKRRTSYTAWKRVADAFDRFAAKFERQVREEPVAQPIRALDPTRWEQYYPEILKIQVLYEDALERIQQGDMTVLLYNEQGVLNDATMLANSWHSELVNNGARGDHFYDGIYVEELTAAIQDFYEAGRDIGYLQPMLGDEPAPESWSTFWLDTIAELPLPSTLPDVPIPEAEVLIETGKELPVFGIYEPQIKDGCMNYLFGGALAPTLWDSDGIYLTGRKLSVIWRLIWEDKRYLDGSIPVEERLYFQETKMPTAAPVLVENGVISATTGQVCPKDGEWAVMDDINAKSKLRAGERMPQHQGRDMTWVCVSN